MYAKSKMAANMAAVTVFFYIFLHKFWLVSVNVTKLQTDYQVSNVFQQKYICNKSNMATKMAAMTVFFTFLFISFDWLSGTVIELGIQTDY